METDELFYEFFCHHPSSLLRLLELPTEGQWHFQSVTVKQRKRHEKRLDGVLTRVDGTPDRRIFAEFQGYPDKAIYWRAMRSVSMYHEHHPDEPLLPMWVLILFLDESFDPGFPVLQFLPPHRLVTLFLPEALERLGAQSGPLAVFKPLFLKDDAELRAQAPSFRREIEALNFPPNEHKFLMEALVYAIHQRLPTLSEKELMHMVQLTPLRKTVAGQDLLLEGRLEGEARGERVGQIRLLRQLLQMPELSARTLKSLRALPLETLDAQIAELRAKLR